MNDSIHKWAETLAENKASAFEKALRREKPADELIRLDTTIIGIDSLINKASTAKEAKVLFTVKDVIYSQQRYVTDVQPVVRCKDCKHRKERHYEENGEKPYIKYECKFTKYSMSDDGFCSFGTRMDLKDGATNG